MPDIQYQITVKRGNGWPLRTWWWTAFETEWIEDNPHMPRTLKGEACTRKGASRAAKRAVDKACQEPVSDTFVYSPRQP